ncbi:MAG TPA: hypothetical protein VGG71_12720, partial [Chitinophagaceae bacterium]
MYYQENISFHFDDQFFSFITLAPVTMSSVVGEDANNCIAAYHDSITKKPSGGPAGFNKLIQFLPQPYH